MTLSIMTIFDDVSAVTKTAFVSDCFLYHAAKCTASLCFLPLPRFLLCAFRLTSVHLILTLQLNQVEALAWREIRPLRPLCGAAPPNAALKLFLILKYDPTVPDDSGIEPAIKSHRINHPSA